MDTRTHVILHIHIHRYVILHTHDHFFFSTSLIHSLFIILSIYTPICVHKCTHTHTHTHKIYFIRGICNKVEFTEVFAREMERVYKLLVLFFPKESPCATINSHSLSLEIIFCNLFLPRFYKKYIYPTHIKLKRFTKQYLIFTIRDMQIFP